MHLLLIYSFFPANQGIVFGDNPCCVVCQVEEKGLNIETADKIGTFVKQRGRPLELLFELKQAGSKFVENSASLQALNELEILFKALEKAKCIDKVVLDLSLARGLDYYTGVIYEAVFKGATQVEFYLATDFPFTFLFGLGIPRQ